MPTTCTHTTASPTRSARPHPVAAAGGDAEGTRPAELTDLGVSSDQVRSIRSRRLDHIAPRGIEIATTPVGPARHPSWAVVRVAECLDAHAEPLSLAVGSTTDRRFWLDFFHDLRARGLRGVEYVVAPEFRGLRRAVRTSFPTAEVISPGSTAGTATNDGKSSAPQPAGR